MTQPAPAGTGNWVLRAVGTGDEAGTAVALEGNGNVAVGGQYRGGSAQFGPTALSGIGDYSVVVARLNPTTRAWVQAVKAGGSIDDFCTGLASGPRATP